MKRIIIALMLVVVLALAMAAPVLADRPVGGVHNHGDGNGGKDWHEWCHAHAAMGHIDHASWQKQCVDKTGWFLSDGTHNH